MIARSAAPGEEIERLHGEAPRVGWNVTVGGFRARSYQWQDYWMTTPVTEIVSDELVQSAYDHDNPDFKPDLVRVVVFKTRSGSTYEWKEF
jgi:hypothetical protein